MTPRSLLMDWHYTVLLGVPRTALNSKRLTHREQATCASGRCDGFGSRQGVWVYPGLDRADANCDGHLHHAAAQSCGGSGSKRKRPYMAVAK